MKLKNVVRRLGNGDVHYVLGRFKTVRVSYSAIRSLRDGGRSRPIAAHDSARPATLFPDFDVDAAVRAIREEAVYVGMKLPPATVKEIEAFSRSEPLFSRIDPNGPTFRHHEVARGRTPDGRAVPMGSIRDATKCDAVRAVVEDPVLRGIVRRYLRYEPTGVLPLLYWSFASDFTDEERRRLKHHVIDYHYDVGGFNFVYASFYILNTDRHSGAHVMMKKSHNRKPLRMLLGKATASEADVHAAYGKENEIVIEGPAGIGFVQDTSCYHRASPPTRGDRLMFQIRFS